MTEIELLVELHKPADRQGPGSAAATNLAISLSGLSECKDLNVLDVGCGTGASTLQLADALHAKITAVDFIPQFLEALETRATAAGVSGKISTVVDSMDALPFEAESFDLIWSEGAIYNIGFENGIQNWQRFLKPGGILAVSELTWLTESRPAELQNHWMNEYPEVATASRKIALLEKYGYQPTGYFPLNKNCWLENYYRPMQSRFADFLERHSHSQEVKSIVEAESAEISLYERYAGYVSYGFYIARK